MKIRTHIRFWLALNFPFLRDRLLSERESIQLSLIVLRKTALLFGHDLSGMSDEELVKNYEANIPLLAKSSGITADEAANRMSNILQQLKQSAR